MFEYIRANKQWVFSGIGVFILGLILTGVFTIARQCSSRPTDKNGNGKKRPSANGNANQLTETKLDWVLLMIEEGDGTIAGSLSEALGVNGLNGIRASELASENAIQVKDALEKLRGGQMNAGSTIPYVVVVKGEVSIHSNQPLQDFAKEPYYKSTADVELQAIDTRNGKSRPCNISAVLGEGKTQDKATRNALQKTGNRIKSFAKEIASMIR